MSRTEQRSILEQRFDAARRCGEPREQRVCGIQAAAAAVIIGPEAYDPPADLPAATQQAFREYLAMFREKPQQASFDLS